MPQPLAAEPYRLHAQDRLMIRVLTWDYGQNNLTGWQDLSGEYSLSPEGDLHLPLAGTISAMGMTQAELITAVSDLLRRRAGLAEPPQLSVELISSLPVYVLGMVETRGAVEFHPGLTARHALARAGGVYRVQTGTDMLRGIMLSGEVTSAESSLRWLRAEQTRIRQELGELESGNVQPDNTSRPQDFQSRLQNADAMARQVRLESTVDLQNVLQERAERLNQQLELRDRQIARTREELAGVESLNERGLAVNARVTSLSTQLSDFEAQRLELETALLLLDEQLNQAQRDGSTITADAIAERLRRLVELEAEISAAEIEANAAREQYLAVTGTPAPQQSSEGPVQTEPRYTLIRGAEALVIGPNTELQPGDTLQITVPTMPETSQEVQE
ncbi:polysaccharide biosynthesis/export family protein [Paracoccus aerodenitrificans]|uniref:polysaccharide biosynthesis/export family protein n=1 Tax=Paracoccus aerodenitrificans TaxID=3017781 RepID=UPI0022F06796|nr:polysaccharide biosynthesis/export family protein [Paracoccus aerodenitrificans]WBU65745.1 polysaccharide biosynthesis/export family protein [Paracoccus aerodenitrificans]